MITPLILNKRGSKSTNQKLRYLEAEVAQIERHHEFFEGAGIYVLVCIDPYLAVDRAELICWYILRVIWTDDAIHITYKDQVCRVPTRQLCSLFSLDPRIPVQESYAAGPITPAEVVKFMGGVKKAVSPKVLYGAI